MSYVHEGRIDEALGALAESRNFADRENLVPAQVNSLLQAAFIQGEAGRLASSVQSIEKAETILEQATLPASTKEGLRLTAIESRARVLAAVHDLDGARSLTNKARAMVEARQNAYEARTLHTVLAQVALEQDRADEAIALLAQADAEDPYNWYYKAVALERKGDKAAASALYDRIAGWNQNDWLRPRAPAGAEAGGWPVAGVRSLARG